MRYLHSGSLALVLSLVSAGIHPSHAEVIGIDTFDYPDGAIAGRDSGFFWNWNNLTGTRTLGSSDWDIEQGSENVEVVGGQLYTRNQGFASREFNGPSEGESSDDFSSDERLGAFRGMGVVYFRVDMTRSAFAEGSWVSSSEFGTERIRFGVDATDQLEISEPAVPHFASRIPVVAERRHIMVGKLDFASDEFSVWVDPDLGVAEGFATFVYGATDVGWSTAVRLGSMGNGATVWDNLVIATSWEELAALTVVTTALDEDNGSVAPNAGRGISLREAIKYAPSGALITFDTELDGEIIALESGELLVEEKALTIDSANLPGGITLSGDGKSRVFRIVGANTELTLDGITIADGDSATGDGGGILNEGAKLTLKNCTIRDSVATNGAAIASVGVTDLSNVTISRNHALGNAGAVHCGASSSTALNHCTISANTADGIVGGISFAGGSLSIENTILAGNSGQDLSNPATSVTSSLIGGDPKLAPLGYFGGQTPTMHPLVGSPAVIDTDTVDTRMDQRGFTLTGTPTIGSVKMGAITFVGSLADGVDASNTLRTAIAENAASTAAIIRFTPNLSGQAITLEAGQLVIPPSANGLFIDASGLEDGLTIDANGSVTQHRVMNVGLSATVALHGLTLSSGNASSPILGFNGGAVRNGGRLSLSHCTLRENSADSGGGAIHSLAGLGRVVLSLSYCTVAANSAYEGGGIYSEGPGGHTLLLRSCAITDNVARFDGRGGGIYSARVSLGKGSYSRLDDCLILRNSSEFGGGIYGDGIGGGRASLCANRCILSLNSAGFRGGGIYSDSADGHLALRLKDCTLSSNFSERDGGGICIIGLGREGSLEADLSGCCISDNVSEGSGGGIFCDGSFSGIVELRLDSCTVSGNVSSRVGGGIFNDDFQGSADLDISACTLSGNTASQGGGIFIFRAVNDVGFNLNLRDSIIAGNVAPRGADLFVDGSDATAASGNNIFSQISGSNIDPIPQSITVAVARLAPLGNYGGFTQVMPPLPGSPAIDAAMNSTRTHDQRGFGISGGVVDIGAAEFQGESDFQLALPLAWNIDEDGDGNSFGVEFALGTDPFLPDPSDPANLEITLGLDEQPLLRFGYNPDAVGYATWSIQRSSDLDSWEEIFHSRDPGNSQTLIDSMGLLPDLFYRFRAGLLPLED